MDAPPGLARADEADVMAVRASGPQVAHHGGEAVAVVDREGRRELGGSGTVPARTSQPRGKCFAFPRRPRESLARGLSVEKMSLGADPNECEEAVPSSLERREDAGAADGSRSSSSSKHTTRLVLPVPRPNAGVRSTCCFAKKKRSARGVFGLLCRGVFVPALFGILRERRGPTGDVDRERLGRRGKADTLLTRDARRGALCGARRVARCNCASSLPRDGLRAVLRKSYAEMYRLGFLLREVERGVEAQKGLARQVGVGVSTRAADRAVSFARLVGQGKA